MKKKKVPRFLLIALMSVFTISACNSVDLPDEDSRAIRTMFTIEENPSKTDPPIFSRIDWSWENKLTIQGTSFSEPFFPGFIGDITTGNIRPLYLNNSILDGSIPLVSNDGRYLAFKSEGKLYIVSMDKIVSNNYFITSNSYVDVVDKDYQCNLAWSPDSNQLASVCLAPNDGITISLYNLTKKSVQDEFTHFEEYRDEIEGASWSSEGNLLAFSLRYEYHDRQLSQTDIFIYHLDNRSLTRVTNTPDVEEREPDWYPGHKILTFTSTTEGDAESLDSSLVFSTVDGNCMKALPNLRGFVYPSWSPDGSQLAYISGWMEIKVLDTSRFVPPDFLSPEGLCSTK